MEKTAKSYKDPALNKIIQEKAAWNKQVSALINDLIHFKKSMNGWPSKYYKERTRITQPVPVDLPGILSQIAGEFQEITSRGNGILQEQSEFSKSHLKRKTDQTLNTLERLRGPVDEKPSPAAPPASPDLSQQLGKGAAKTDSLVKLANEFENKYFLESQASNPFTRFVSKLFTPQFGFGEGARIRRLRMTMLDSCVKTFKTLKQLHKEIVKSSKGSIVNSHKMMTLAWNYWNIVNRLYSAYNIVRPGKVVEQGGEIEDPKAKEEREAEGRESEGENVVPQQGYTSDFQRHMQDYSNHANAIGAIANNSAFRDLVSLIERLKALPKGKQPDQSVLDAINIAYSIAVGATNEELGTNAGDFQGIIQQYNANPKKEAQFRGLSKIRHQILPGATSGSRLEVYNLIDQIRKDLDHVMNLLESGFDQKQLTPAIAAVNKGMTSLRTMIRSLYYSEKPEEAPPMFF